MKKALNALNVKSNNNLSMVITEANDAYKGGLVEDRTMYIPADQLESDDWAGTLVHEFTHFEEGSREYAIMADFLQSDEILVDDDKGGKVKLSEKARATVLAKGYGFTVEQLDAVLAKANTDAKLTAEESEIYEVYATELTAHETEIVLGNEAFIDRIIAEDGSAAEKLVSRILKLDKGLSSMKDKQVRAQAKLIKQAEKLYLKAAEKAGNKRIVKMILAQRPELEEALTGTNEEKMHVSEKRYIGLEEFTDRDNKLWRNVAYEDNETKAQITKELHSKMVEEGLIVKVSDEISEKVSESYPNLQSMKKKERLPILKKAIEQLKQNLRDFLNGFKGKNFEFEINGEILEAKLYNVGINEVLEKITQEKAQMLYVTEEIFKSAKYLYSTPDYDGDPNVYRWNYFYTPVQIGEDVVGVRIAIRDMATPKESQIYNWGIKKDTSLEGIGRGTNDRISYGISSDVSNNSISHSAEKSTENAKKVSDDDKKVSFNLKAKKDDLGDFFADDNDGGPVYKVSGGKVRKVIADNTRMKVYTRAESEQIVNQIVSENLSFGELYGSLQGKSRREIGK